MIGRSKDPESLSTKPYQIRNRLRRAVGTDHYQEDLELYRRHNPSYKPVEDWDIEELARGKPRSKDGKFHGRTAIWITPEVTREAKKRLLEHTNALLGAQVDKAMEVVVNLMMNEEVDDKGRPVVDAATKLKAAQFIIEHVKGKATAFIEVDNMDMTKRMIASAIVLDDGQVQDEPIILEGDFTEGEEEEDLDDDDE